MNSFKVKLSTLYFVLLQLLVILFWGIPEIIQKPFKISLLLFFFYFFLTLLAKKKIAFKQVFFFIIILIASVMISLHGAFQSSLINVVFSSSAMCCLSTLHRQFTIREVTIAKKICYLVCFLMTLQLIFCRSLDGRPNLAYEINWSAAYLFLFFLYSHFLNFKFGKIFVFITSFLLLSRLLFLSIAIFYIIRLLKKKQIIPQSKLKWGIVYIVSCFLFFIFNFWFLLNVEVGDSYDTSINRVKSVNDGSNMLRFTINASVIEGLFIDHDSRFKYGYGQISRGASPLYESKYRLMPHNELLDSIAEFGYIFTIIVFFFLLLNIKNLFLYENYEYIFPILIYTFILWARFLLVPSLEMFFIFSLMGNNLKKNEVDSFICK